MLSYYIDYPAFLSPYVIPSFPLVRWYSLMYVVAFAVEFALFRHQLKKGEMRLRLDWRKGEDVDMLVWVTLGVILGARLGSCLIYSGSYYWHHPHLIFWPFADGKFQGLPGMSYHGGVVGACVAALIMSKKKKVDFFDISDPIVIAFPFGYFFGRIGNFMNAELYGKVSTSSLGMVFPGAERFSTSFEWVREACLKVGMDPTALSVNLPRHPSMLYEAVFEGIALGAIMWFWVRPRALKMRKGVPSGLYLVIYGAFRFVIEYFRQPDSNIGYVVALGPLESHNIHIFSSLLNFSMGQILCLVMIAVGIGIILVCRKAREPDGLAVRSSTTPERQMCKRRGKR